MKKALFTLILSISSLFSIAQDASVAAPSGNGPKKGSLFAFGTIGVTSEKPAGVNTKSSGKFTFAPGAGYFITDRIALGARLLITKQFGSGQKGGSEFGLQAFGRYYFLQDMFSTKGGFFLEGNLGFSSAKPQYTDTPGVAEPGSISTFGLGVGPGFALFPTKRIGFEFALPNLLSFYATSSGGSGSGGSGFGLGASTLSTPSVTFLYFIK